MLTPHKAKLYLAKLLPERIQVIHGKFYDAQSYLPKREILDTEWLQIVQWVEKVLTPNQQDKYGQCLAEQVYDMDNKSKCPWTWHATYQQRLAALEAVGIIKV